jgi:hypothetical protein
MEEASEQNMKMTRIRQISKCFIQEKDIREDQEELSHSSIRKVIEIRILCVQGHDMNGGRSMITREKRTEQRLEKVL